MPTGIGSGIAGEVFTDEIGSGSRGGSTICPTRYSVNLNGSSQFGLETGTLLDLGTDNFSYSFWFKTSEASVQGITSTDLSNSGTGLDIFLSATGILTATFDSVTFPTTASLNDGEWYHAVLSVDRSGDWKWYIDGVNTNTLANPVGTAIFVGTYMWGVDDISSPSFNGNLTELSIWGTALSSSEVLTIYNNMFGSQTCLTDLTFSSGNLIQNGSFNEIGPQLIDNPTFNAPTSPDLIVNGDFSAEGANTVLNPNFTDTGSELVVNGNFLSATSWNVNSNWNINTALGVAEADGTSNSDINQGVWLPVIGTSYKVTFEVVSRSQGEVLFKLGGVNGTSRVAPGIYTEYIVATTNDRIRVDSTNLFIGSVKNISVKELGADWIDSGSPLKSATFDANGLTITSVNGNGNANRVNQASVTENDKSYKVTYTINSVTLSGSNAFQYYNGSAYVTFSEQGVGTHTFYYKRQGVNNAFFLRIATNDGSTTDFVTISSISVQELGEGWTLQDGWSIGDDEAIFSGTDFYTIATSAPVVEVGKSYKLNFDATVTNGGFKVFNGVQLLFSTDGGSFEHYFTADGTKLAWARYSVGLQNDFTITNITVQEVDWNFGGGWSLGSNKALATAAVGGDTLSQTGVFTLDKSYKTTFLSTMEVGDNCFAEFGSDGFIGQLPTGTASNLFYYQTNEVGDSARIAFEVQSIMTGSISNVLTYQMDPNGYWNIPTANSTQLVLNPTFTNTGPEQVTNGDFSQTALGTELVTNGDFATDTGWSKGTGWTISGGTANCDGTQTGGSSLYQSVMQQNKSYSISFEITARTAGGVGVQNSTKYTAVGTYTYYYTLTSADTNLYINADVDFIGSIDNVSVKEVLQEITNGDFTDGVELLTQPIDLTADFIPNGSGVIDDSNSFTTTGGVFDGLRNNSSSFQLIDGKSYKLVIAGTTTSSGFTIGSVTASGNEYGTGFGTHYFVATTANPTTLWIRQQTAGTTDLTTFTIEELGEGWTTVTDTGSVTFANDQVQIISDGSAATGITQNILSLGKSYKVVIDVASLTGKFKILLGTELTEVDEDGIQTFYGVAGGGVFYLYRVGGEAVDVVLNSVSVQELGADWTLETGWSIGENKAIANTTGTQQLYQDVSLVNGKSYKITYKVADFVSGALYLSLDGNGFISPPSTSDDNSVVHYVTYSGSDGRVYFRGSPNVNCSITNVTVEETGLDWVSPDAGVVNTFSATGLTMTSVNGAGDNTIQQVGVTADDQAYKVDYNIVGSSLTAGNYLQFYNGATYVNMKTTVGSHILHFTRSGADDSVFLKLASNDGSTTDTVDIGSITIVEVQGWTLEDGKLVGDLPDLAKSATQDIGAIAGNSYKATMDVAIAEEELITNGSFRQVGADLVLDGDFPLPNVNWLIAASTTINGGSATFGGLGTVADLLAAAFVVRVEADGGVAEAQSCLISDLTFLTEKP